LYQITGLKTILIALVWSVATVYVPVLQSMDSPDNFQTLFIFTERFAFIFAIAIPFDIRDMGDDTRNGIKTIPLAFGEKSALRITNIALLLCALIASVHYVVTDLAFIIPAFLFSILCTAYFINQKPLQTTLYYYHGILDGSILLHGILITLSFYLHP
jgi:4-hydroxybenzoate polyprenyltransferase